MAPTTFDTTHETTFDKSERLRRNVTEGRNNIDYNICQNGRAHSGAASDAGAAEEVVCHADI